MYEYYRNTADQRITNNVILYLTSADISDLCKQIPMVGDQATFRLWMEKIRPHQQVSRSIVVLYIILILYIKCLTTILTLDRLPFPQATFTEHPSKTIGSIGSVSSAHYVLFTYCKCVRENFASRTRGRQTLRMYYLNNNYTGKTDPEIPICVSTGQ